MMIRWRQMLLRLFGVRLYGWLNQCERSAGSLLPLHAIQSATDIHERLHRLSSNFTSIMGENVFCTLLLLCGSADVVRLPAGTFEMGSDRAPDEAPVRSVTPSAMPSIGWK